MKDFRRSLTENDKTYELLLRHIQEHRNLYADCKNETSKQKFKITSIHMFVLSLLVYRILTSNLI